MKRNLQQQAIVLRRAGISIRAIANELGISQSTSSRWCKDVQLTTEQRNSLEAHRKESSLAALRPWIELNRKKKLDDQLLQEEKGSEDIGMVSVRDLFILGLGLYWGEGYKRGSQECGFTNSDPAIIRIILRWFETCYGISRERISARLTINEIYKDETERITNDWITNTGISLAQFSTPTYITGYGKPSRDPRTYRGTLRIKVRNGTSLRRRILASIAAIET